MQRSLIILLLGMSTIIWGQQKGNLHEKCSEFVGGKVGEVDYFIQLCYDSTFYFQEWHANGHEVVDEGTWWYNRSDRTVVLYSEQLRPSDYAFYQGNLEKSYIFDSIPYKMINAMIYLFEEEWDTLAEHLQREYQKRILYYVIPYVESEEQIAYRQAVDSVRRLGPFHKNPIYRYLFMTEDKGFFGWKNKRIAKKAARKEEKENKNIVKQENKALKEQEATEAYVKKQEEKHKKNQTRLEYIQEIHEKQSKKKVER